MKKLFQKLRKRSGASLVEYTIILMLVAVVAVVILRAIGSTTANSLTPVNNALQ